MEIHLPDLRDGYVMACQQVMLHGDPVEVRGLKTREMLGVTIVLKNVLDVVTLPIGVNRGVNTRLAAVEALCMIGGVWQQKLVERAAPNYGEVLVSQSEADAVAVAYGTRIRTQLPTIMHMLRQDPTTRQAVLAIWDLTDLTRTGDRPCTLILQFLLRNDRLECHTYMRSQDVWLGLGMDVFVFTQLQLTVANYLDVEPGRFVHHVGSLHAYTRDLEKIERLRTHDRTRKSLLNDGFPRGVNATVRDNALIYMRDARMLLDGIPSPLNPWYERQIGRLYDSA